MENEDTLLTINQQEPDEPKHLVNMEQGHQVICLFAECRGRFIIIINGQYLENSADTHTFVKRPSLVLEHAHKLGLNTEK